MPEFEAFLDGIVNRKGIGQKHVTESSVSFISQKRLLRSSHLSERSPGSTELLALGILNSIFGRITRNNSVHQFLALQHLPFRPSTLHITIFTLHHVLVHCSLGHVFGGLCQLKTQNVVKTQTFFNQLLLMGYIIGGKMM